MFVLLVIYVTYYYRYPEEVAILQNTVGDMDLNALLQKQPIVVEDQVLELEALANAWFKFHYKTSVTPLRQDTEAWARNRYKYLMIQPATKAEIMMYPPAKPILLDGAPDPNETLLVIPLEANQPVILPLHWRYRFLELNTDYTLVGAHDWMTWLLP